MQEVNLIITKIDGFKIIGEVDGEQKTLSKSKFGKIAEIELKIGVPYSATITEKGDVLWLNSVQEVKEKPLTETKPAEKTKPVSTDEFKTPQVNSKKFQALIDSTAPMDNKQLLIMAQSAQHDAAALIKDKVDQTDYGSVEEFAADVIQMRDILLKDLVEKYYK